MENIRKYKNMGILKIGDLNKIKGNVLKRGYMRKKLMLILMTTISKKSNR